MDLETLLRRRLVTGDEFATFSTNDEGRVIMVVGEREFVIVENTAIPYPVEAPKPPTQRMSIEEGIDAHGAMGQH